METIKDIAGGLLTLIIVVALLALENAVQAQTGAVRIGEGGQVTVVCGQSQPDLELPDPDLPPPPPIGDDPAFCPLPDPAVVAEGKLIGGQQRLLVSDQTTVLKFFSVEGDFDAIELSWDAGIGGPHQLSVSVSECRGDFDIQELPRECFRGSSRDRIVMSQDHGGGVCELNTWTEYFVNISARNIVTGAPTCRDGRFCEINLYVDIVK